MTNKFEENSVPIVAIAQVGNFEGGRPEFVDRHAPLMRAIGDRGFRAVALDGARDKDGEGGFSRFYVSEEGLLVPRDGSVRVDAAYDLSGGVGRQVPEVLALNPRSIRDLASSKAAHSEVLRLDLGDVIPQSVSRPATKEAIENGLDEIEADEVIVKANRDPHKKHPMLIGTKDAVRGRIDDLLQTTKPIDLILIQEYMPEVNGGFASDLQYADATEKEFAASKKEGAKEVRVRVIDEEPVAVMGRAGLNVDDRQQDKWVHFAPESVPSHIPALGVAVAKVLRAKAGVEDSDLGVDLTPDGLRFIEANGRNIGTMRPDAERPAAQRIHEIVTNALADKLTAMAVRKRSGR